MRKLRLKRWDAAEELRDEAQMTAYLEAALEEGEPALVAAALGDLARARGMSEVARRAGVSSTPLMPRSKSRATVRSAASSGFSRCEIPRGVTHAAVNRSYRNAARRSPRFRLTAVWMGVSTCRSPNTTPVAASGTAIPSPRWTAATSAPIATANTAGSTPCRTTTVHQASARAPSALGSAANNSHSLRPYTRSRTDTCNTSWLGWQTSEAAPR